MVLRRVAAIPVTLVVISLLVFLATEILPGDVARTILGREAGEASVARLRATLGLDQPLPQRFVQWAVRFVSGDWGTSFTLGVPVRGLVIERLGNSLLLAVFAFVLLVPVALTIGVISGLHHDRPTDRVLSGVSMVLGATPEFVTGVVLLVVFAVKLKWFPASAQTTPHAGLLTRLDHLVLPAVSLVALCTGYVARHVRASTISVVDSSYVHAAELRGSTRGQVIRRHVLRNATVPAVSALGVQAQFLLGGLVAVELLFNYPGIGALLLASALNKDLPTLQATAVVLGLLYVLIMIAVDVTYRLLDPRIRRGVVA